MLAAEPDALEVHVHDAVPRRLRGLGGATVVGREDARVVVEDVQPAEALHGEPHHRLDLVAARDVDLHERGFAAGALDGGDGAGAELLVEVGDDDAGAFTGEQLGGAAPHAVARARDERDLAVEPSHAPS